MFVIITTIANLKLGMASNLPLESLVSCCVCFEVYTQPSILPCLHTLCWPCVQLLKTGHRISCPECRVVSPVRTIKKDFNKQQLIEIYHRYEESQNQVKEVRREGATGGISGDRCELCRNPQKTARLKCVQCNKNLCGECEEIHKSIPICEQHIVFALEKESLNGTANTDVQNKLGVLCNKEQLLRENIGRLKRHITELNKLNVNVCSEISNHENTLISHVQGHYKSLRQEVEGMINSELEQVNNSLRLLDKHLAKLQDTINDISSDKAEHTKIKLENFQKDIDMESLERDLADSKRHPLLKLVIESGRSWNSKWGHRVEAEKVFTTLKREMSRRDMTKLPGAIDNSKAQTDKIEVQHDRHQEKQLKQPRQDNTETGASTSKQQTVNAMNSAQRPTSPEVVGHNRSKSVPSRHNPLKERRKPFVTKDRNIPQQPLKLQQGAQNEPPPSYDELGAIGSNQSGVQVRHKPLTPSAPEDGLPLYTLTSSPRVRSPRPRSPRNDVPFTFAQNTAASSAEECQISMNSSTARESNFGSMMATKNGMRNTMIPYVSLSDKLFTSIDSTELAFKFVKIHWYAGLLWCTGKSPDGLYIYNASCELNKEIQSSTISGCNAIIPIQHNYLLAASENGLLLLDAAGEHLCTLAAGSFSDCAYSQDSEDLVGLQYRQQKIFIFRQVSSLMQKLGNNIRPDKVIDVPKPNDFSRFFIFQGEGFSVMDTLSIANQQVYVCRHKSMGPVYCLNMNGKIIREYTGKLTPFPQISCIDNFGNIILTDNDKRCVIKVCTSTGQWRLVDMPEGTEGLCGAAVDNLGENVWVVTKSQDAFKLVHFLTYDIEPDPGEALEMMYSYN